MNKRFIALTYILVIVLTRPLFSAVKQVRVTAERASIYIEPSRTSSRIDIVEKGVILNLFQQKKIKDVWYYVIYSSLTYGTRVSGFIHESSVELVAELGAPPPKQEQAKKPEKPQQIPVLEKPAPPPPKIEEKKEIKAEAKPIPKTEESLALTSLPKSKSFKFPRKEPLRQEIVWRPLVVPEKKEEKKVMKVEEFTVLTPLSRPRSISLPRREKTREDVAWKILTPVKEEKKKPPEKASVEVPKEPEPSKAQPAPVVKKEEPAAPPTPVQPSRMVEPKKGRGFLTFGLGYGSSLGGAGGFLQLNTKFGLALHGGVGLYPTKVIYSETDWVKNEPLYSIGIKYYLPFKSASVYPYLDLQYGGLRVEAAQIIMGVWESSYVYSHEQKTLWGPSFLGGAEIKLGRFGINGAMGISYNITEWEFQKQKLFLAFDASLVIYF